MHESIQKLLNAKRYPWSYQDYNLYEIRSSPELLLLLSDKLRKLRDRRSTEDLNQIFQKIYFSQEEKIDALGLLSLSSNGYFREKALENLAGFESVYILPYVILRLQDWVLPVRQAAEKLFMSHAKFAKRSDWEQFAFIFNRLLVRGQGAEINRLLISHMKPRFTVEDRSKWFLNTKKDMRHLLWTLFSDAELKSVATPEFISAESDPKLAGEIFSRLSKILPRDTVIETGIRHSSNKIRYQALQALFKDRAPELKSITETALSDKSANVRDLARFIYHARFGLRTKDYFKDFNVQPNDKEARLGFVLGWLESTDENPERALEFHKQSPRAKIRGSALMAYARMGGYTPEAPTLIVKALESDSYSRDTAAKLIKMGWASEISQSIWEMADREQNIKRQLRLIGLAVQSDRKNSLMPALRRMPRSLPVIQAALHHHIRKWSRQPRIPDLTHAQKIEGRELIDQLKLTKRAKDSLRFLFI